MKTKPRQRHDLLFWFFLKKVGCLCHCAILRINENDNLKDRVCGLVSTWRTNSETA